MTTIPISSCHKCSPEKWKKLRESVGSYRCLKCRRLTYVVLKRKGKGEV